VVLTANVATTRTTRRVNVIDRRSVWVRMDWVVVTSGAALLAVGTLLVWSATASNEALTGGDSTMYVAKHLTNVAIGLVLAALIASADHRWVRIWAPIVYLAAIVGLALVLSPFGAVINGSRSWILIGLTGRGSGIAQGELGVTRLERQADGVLKCRCECRVELEGALVRRKPFVGRDSPIRPHVRVHLAQQVP